MRVPLKKRPMLALAIVVAVLGALLIVGLPLLVHGYPLAPGDRIASWSWRGPYRDGATNETATRTRIRDLQEEIGKTGNSTYDLYVDIASEYELLGDGGNAYRYLSKAIAKDPTRGIAYLNMGHLMEELGALHTAKAAYAKAAAAEPDNALYQGAVKDFETRHPSL